MTVSTYESFESLSDMRRHAVVDLLYRMADDELLMGWGDSTSNSLAPSPADGAALVSMGRDEVAHARVYYQMLHGLGEPEPTALALSRNPREFRNASLVCQLSEGWPFCVVRRFLYDVQESVRLAALLQSALAPLAVLARELHDVERAHLSQGRAWVLQLGRAGRKHRDQMQEALYFTYPHALGLFEPTEADEPLTQANISPREEQLRREWESAVAPVFDDAGLTVPANMEPVYGGRVGKHPESLSGLLADLRSAYKNDPPAGW
jgi:ring-1,2-phenylacetyl-CoA epoxidase subunit PaaC